MLVEAVHRAAFFQASPELRLRQHALLTASDIAFIGEPRMHEAKRFQHPAIAHPLLQDLPHSRVGFFSVLDERLDCRLLAPFEKAKSLSDCAQAYAT